MPDPAGTPGNDTDIKRHDGSVTLGWGWGKPIRSERPQLADSDYTSEDPERMQRKSGYLERSGRYSLPREWMTQTLNDSESLGEWVIVGPKDRTSCQVTRTGVISRSTGQMRV